MCDSSWSLFLLGSAPGVSLGVFFFFGGWVCCVFFFFLEFFSSFEGLKVLTLSASLAASPAALTPFAQA